MALSRRTGTRFQASIWPGFVDAMTGLLLVLMFVLTIFMVVQFVLRETITGQESELDKLSSEVAALSRALGLEQDRNATLSERVGELTATLGVARERQDEQQALITALQGRNADQAARIASFEEQVAGLLAGREANLGTIADLEVERDDLLSEQDSLETALAGMRDEVDAQAEAARLAAAQRAALEALIADLRQQNAEEVAGLQATVEELRVENADAVAALEARLSDAEAARLAEAAAADALRERLENADAELTAMTLALEEERRRAEETLTMLAAAREAEADLDDRLAAALLAEEDAGAEAAALEARIAELLSSLERAETEIGAARAEADAARAELAAARSDMETASSDAESLQAQVTDLRAALADAETEAARARSEAEAAGSDASRSEDRIAELLARLETAETEAMSAEEVRAQLAAALAAKLAAEAEAEAGLGKAEERAALLAEARAALAEQEELTEQARLQQEALSRQVAALREQLGGLQALLDDAKAREAAKDVQLQSLGNELNAALARVAAEERKRADLEEEKRQRLEEEKQALEQYRSEFFGRLRDLLGTQDGVRIVGDRFVFSSEVLFAPGEARLSPEGEREIANVARILRSVAGDIPEGIDWVLQVDGHTDNVPIVEGARFADNWELSQARALSVVRYMVGTLDFPPERLSANGFGQYQPISPGDTAQARAQNRRIELKLTEK